MSIHNFTENYNPPPVDGMLVGGGKLPHNIDIEQGLLGALLIDNRNLETVSGVVKPEHFYEHLHADIYSAIVAENTAGRSASPVTLQFQFEDYPDVSDDMTVGQYLGRLAFNSAPSVSVKSYAETLADLARRREVIGIAQDMICRASAPEKTTASVIEDAESNLFTLRISTSSRHNMEFSMSEAVDQAINQANAAHEIKGGLFGLSTGLVDVDNTLGGLAPSDLIILGGRPSMGKTALATNIANTTASTGGFVHFFSQEMSAQQLATRLIAERADLSSADIRRGKFHDEEFRRMSDAGRELAKLPIHIDQTGGIKLAQLAMRARRMKDRHDTKLVVIDYLQLMSPPKSGGNRVQDITEITTGLKALAKELGVPVLALSQLSRALETREDKRPQLSDLRESGSIEQDADVVMFVFREEYYVERRKPSETDFAAIDKWEAELTAVAGKGEVIIGKQRHGPTGTVEVQFDAARTRFSNLAKEDRTPPKPEPYRSSHILPTTTSQRAMAQAVQR